MCKCISRRRMVVCVFVCEYALTMIAHDYVSSVNAWHVQITLNDIKIGAHDYRTNEEQ